MKLSRTVAVLLLAFLFGGSSAEVAVQTKRALDRHRAAEEDGAAGELVALEIQRPDGEVVARPRLIATPGRSARLELRDPEHPNAVRLSLRIQTSREPSGDVEIAWDLSMPGEALQCSGRVSMTPGVERPLDLGDHPLTAVLLALPVPSAAFDAYLDAERSARRVAVEPI
ncbi:MAG TPA: hypothetical protein VFP65_10445 [Anaeromyxobacteraceae bacterium]|nr:hypothetical protein [Anaeromyxobacteraceae bacterium]